MAKALSNKSLYSCTSPNELSSIRISPLVTCPNSENETDDFLSASRNASSFISATETTTRDGDSPNKKASSQISPLEVISKPKPLGMALSNRVINKPPSATS